MMLPSNHPSAPPVPASMPPPTPAVPTTGGIEKSVLPHADYNLQPLKVDCLGHYLPPTEEPEEERFHVR